MRVILEWDDDGDDGVSRWCWCRVMNTAHYTVFTYLNRVPPTKIYQCKLDFTFPRLPLPKKGLLDQARRGM
jgi:hypothetical protein